MKRILLALIALLTATATQADTVKWGYSYIPVATQGLNNGIGNYLYCGFKMPAAQLAPYVGMKAVGVEVALGGKDEMVLCNEAFTFLAAWDTATDKPLLGNPAQADATFLAKSAVDKNPGIGWQRIDFATPMDITAAQDLLVGAGVLSTSPQAAKYGCIGCDNDLYTTGTCWCWDDSGWADYGLLQSFPGFCMRLVIEGDRSFRYDGALLDAQVGAAVPSRPLDFSALLVNLGSETMTAYSLDYTYSNGQTGTVQGTCNLAPGASQRIQMALPAFTEKGQYDVTCHLATVDGAADEAQENSTFTTTLDVTEYDFTRVVVVEEGTGTWCQWCVRGIVGLEKMREEFPNSFIGIAAHSSDEMQITAYNPLLSRFSTFPNSAVNRKGEYVVDPSYETLRPIYKSEAAMPAEAAIVPTVAYDAAAGVINIDTKTVFREDRTGLNYRLAYVIVEDEVGPYRQKNGFSGGSEEMGGWEKLDPYVTTKFNDVARDIKPSFYGQEGSVPADVKRLTENEASYQFTVPTNVTNTDNCRLIILLLDATSGHIINATQRRLDGSIIGQEGVHSVLADKAGEPGYYDLTGRRVSESEMQHGQTYIHRDGHKAAKVIK